MLSVGLSDMMNVDDDDDDDGRMPRVLSGMG